MSDIDFVSCTQESVLQFFDTSLKGLSEKEAIKRLEEYGYNEPAKKKKRTVIFQIFIKFLNPLVVVLLIIAGFSMFFGEKIMPPAGNTDGRYQRIFVIHSGI